MYLVLVRREMLATEQRRSIAQLSLYVWSRRTPDFLSCALILKTKLIDVIKLGVTELIRHIYLFKNVLTLLIAWYVYSIRIIWWWDTCSQGFFLSVNCRQRHCLHIASQLLFSNKIANCMSNKMARFSPTLSLSRHTCTTSHTSVAPDHRTMIYLERWNAKNVKPQSKL